MIAHYLTTITHKKEIWKKTVEMVAKSEDLEKDETKKRAMRRAGYDTNLEKYSIEKYTFTFELKKGMEEPLHELIKKL